MAQNDFDNVIEVSPPTPDAVLLDWKALKLNATQIQQDNLKTLVDIWPSLTGSYEQNPKWGDEIEYVLLRLDHTSRYAKLSPQGSTVVEQMGKDKSTDAVDIQRECYEYMVETSPLAPYNGDIKTLTTVEQNMQHRREAIQRQLGLSTTVFSLSRFGMFGALHSRTPDGAATPEAVKQEAVSLITQGARYKPVLDAIAKKRGYPMSAEVPLYDSAYSSSGSAASISSASSESDFSLTSDSVTVDDPIYAVGGCAVQVNFGMKDMSQALYVHDQFCPIGPLMLAMTAASPILKGCLVSTDARWDHCRLASDDRPKGNTQLNPRWGTSPMYFQDQAKVQALNHPLHSEHPDLAEYEAELTQAGLPAPLATYYAHALTRDPMMHPKSLPGTTQDGDLNDRIVRLKTHLSALWPHIRLKFPSLDGSMPWIVEFRSMETQPTDHEIAGIVIFLKVLQQTILHYNLELRVPMSMIEQNMVRAQDADAAVQQKFWFNVSNSLPSTSSPTTTSSFQELSLNEIFNGQSSASSSEPFPGLLYHVRNYLSENAEFRSTLSVSEQAQIDTYLSLISKRASGAEPTPAKWMRDFVMTHPDYNHDSQVTQEMYYEMMCEIGKKSKLM